MHEPLVVIVPSATCLFQDSLLQDDNNPRDYKKLFAQWKLWPESWRRAARAMRARRAGQAARER